MLSNEVMASISQITGLSLDQMKRMDIYQEKEYIQSRNWKKLVYPTKRDARRSGRGNPLIARRRFRDIEFEK